MVIPRASRRDLLSLFSRVNAIWDRSATETLSVCHNEESLRFAPTEYIILPAKQERVLTMRSFRLATGLSLTFLGYAVVSPITGRAIAAPSESKRPAPVNAARRVTQRTDPRVANLLRRVEAASRAAKTMTADFTYSVTGIKRAQFVTGSIRLRKPNFARIEFSHVAEPAYPNVFASDGKKVYIFTPSNFDARTRTFSRDAGFDPVSGAKSASGLGGGGKVTTLPAEPDGSNIHLWDSIAIQSFFNVQAGIGYLYHGNISELRYEGEQTLDGVKYRVISHYFANGNIAGKEQSPFWQRLYIGPDDLIHRYVLEFRSGGRPGVQMMRLENIRLNAKAPLTPADFAVPVAAPR